MSGYCRDCGNTLCICSDFAEMGRAAAKKTIEEIKEKFMNKTDLLIPDLFKAEDFAFHGGTKEIVEIANARLREWAAGLKKVYAQKPDGVSELWSCTDRQRIDTHVALLAFPQEIKKAECEHEPISYSEGATVSYERLRWILANKAECKKCGAKLVAKWEAADV